jgi:hypothetical protein
MHSWNHVLHKVTIPYYLNSLKQDAKLEEFVQKHHAHALLSTINQSTQSPRLLCHSSMPWSLYFSIVMLPFGTGTCSGQELRIIASVSSALGSGESIAEAKG